MISVSNDELGEEVNEGDTIRISSSGGGSASETAIGILKWCNDSEGKKSKLLGVIETNETSYLVAVEGKLLPWAERVKV